MSGPIRTQGDIEVVFDSHPPATEGDRIAHERIRESFKAVARQMLSLPESRERSLVFTKLEEASFFAHAAIARQ